jgi:hypothetical protein
LAIWFAYALGSLALQFAFTKLRSIPTEPAFAVQGMNMKTRTRAGLLCVVVAFSGCSGGDSLTAPLAPSPPQAVTPTVPEVVVPIVPGSNWLNGYTLTAASLSGVVYEMTAAGRMPIPFAVVYCELCGQITHSLATANADGFYSFSGDLATGGGVWLSRGQLTPIIVRGVNYEEDTWIGRNVNVAINGDTRLDIELVRR